MTEELKVEFTKKGFENFCVALNHRMTVIENDVKWIKKLMYYIAGIVSVAVGKIIFFS